MDSRRQPDITLVHYTASSKRGRKKYWLRFPSRYMATSKFEAALPLIRKVLVSLFLALLAMAATLLAGVAISLVFLK